MPSQGMQIILTSGLQGEISKYSKMFGFLDLTERDIGSELKRCKGEQNSFYFTLREQCVTNTLLNTSIKKVPNCHLCINNNFIELATTVKPVDFGESFYVGEIISSNRRISALNVWIRCLQISLYYAETPILKLLSSPPDISRKAHLLTD